MASRTLCKQSKVYPQTVTSFTGAGEAQKIDRIMERFAERYCKDNPDAFQTSDGAYLLSFALIMLNTDAHNPMADKKLSLEDFISMCQYQVSIPCDRDLVTHSLELSVLSV